MWTINLVGFSAGLAIAGALLLSQPLLSANDAPAKVNEVSVQNGFTAHNKVEQLGDHSWKLSFTTGDVSITAIFPAEPKLYTQVKEKMIRYVATVQAEVPKGSPTPGQTVGTYQVIFMGDPSQLNQPGLDKPEELAKALAPQNWSKGDTSVIVDWAKVDTSVSGQYSILAKSRFQSGTVSEDVLSRDIVTKTGAFIVSAAIDDASKLANCPTCQAETFINNFQIK